MQHTVYTVAKDALERDALRLERIAEQSLKAWILCGLGNRYSEHMTMVRVLRSAAKEASINIRREILRNSGVAIKSVRQELLRDAV